MGTIKYYSAIKKMELDLYAIMESSMLNQKVAKQFIHHNSFDS